MKDLFSKQSTQYAIFRPHYPEVMYHYLYQLITNFETAWDCGTGNGQVAAALAEKFKQVYATDISPKQLEHAIQKENIVYEKAAAEQTVFPDAFFDLVTVAQAIHWFKFDEFYAEIKRVLKPTGLIAVIGYGLIRINDTLNALIDDFYKNKVGPFWDKERKYIDDAYKTIPFPFVELPSPKLSIHYNWNLEQFTGYLGTWSAVQNYIDANETSPIDAAFLSALHKAWPHHSMQAVEFPLYMRIGKLN